MRFEGIYTPIITPFFEDGSIDWDSYGDVIDWQIENGIAGIVVGGSTGEFYALSKEDRIKQFEYAAKRINGRAEMMAGVNDLRVEECLEISAAAKAAGAQSLLVAAPPYSLPSEAELAAHVLKIDSVVDLSIMLYNYPGRTGVNMGEDFLNRVSQSSNICGIKESSGDYTRLPLLMRQYPSIELAVGGDDQVLEFAAWGAKAWVSASGNFFPSECTRFLKLLSKKGDFARGRRVMAALMPLMTALEQGGKFIQSVKYCCELQGRPGGIECAPLRPMKKELKREMEEILRHARLTVNSILNEKE